MQIIDTILFSELFEKESLIIKLILDGERISKRIIVENAYTSERGDKRGI